jgi:hypothetical protein
MFQTALKKYEATMSDAVKQAGPQVA